MSELDAIRREIFIKIERMVGYVPVGFGDLLNIITSPDMLPLTEQLLEESKKG